MATNIIPSVLKLQNNSGTGVWVRLGQPAPAVKAEDSNLFMFCTPAAGTVYGFYIHGQNNLMIRNLNSGTEWNLGTSIQNPVSACFHKGILYICDENENCFTVDLASHGSAVSLAEPEGVSFRLLAAGASVWAISSLNRLYVLGADNTWSPADSAGLPPGISAFSGIGSMMFIGTEDGGLYSFDEHTLSSTLRTRTGNAILSISGRDVALNNVENNQMEHTISVYMTSENVVWFSLYQKGTASASEPVELPQFQNISELKYCAFDASSGFLQVLGGSSGYRIYKADPVTGTWLFATSQEYRNTALANGNFHINGSTTSQPPAESSVIQFSEDRITFTENRIYYITQNCFSPDRKYEFNQSYYREDSEFAIPVEWPLYPENNGIKLGFERGIEANQDDWIITVLDIDPVRNS